MRTRGSRAIGGLEKGTIDVVGISASYLRPGLGAGGPPLVLLHGVGTSAEEWAWVLPALARYGPVYALDLPGYAGSGEPPDHAPAFTARFVDSFLGAVGVESAVVVGSSFGGLTALHLAFSEPERVRALVLADGAGLGLAVNPVLVTLTLPVWGEMAVARDKTPLGAAQRALRRASLMFTRPWQVPPRWLAQQFGLAQQPNFTETTRQSLRHAVGLGGQREVFLDRLPGLRMPTLLVWGVEDRVIPYWQATAAAALLEKGALGPIPNCGHLPHVERPERFVSILGGFLEGLRRP